MRAKISLKYVLAGGFLGFLVIHPLVMIFGQWMLHHKISWNTIFKIISFKIFSLNMLPWSLAFTVLGMSIGILYSKNKQSMRNLSEAQNKLEIQVKERTSELVKANKELQIEIIERKKIEEALKKENNFSQNILNTAQAIILVLDVNGCIVKFNPYMEIISGYRLEEVIGKDWYSTFLPKVDHDKIRALFKKAVGDIQTKGHVNPIVSKDGREIFIEWYDRTLKDDNGKTIGLLAIGQDITNRKKIEEELFRTQKLSALGKMLTGISHEVKNPLAGIGMILKSVAEGFNEQDSCYQDIKKILNEIKRIENILNNMVNFSKAKPLVLNKTNIIEPLEKSLHILNGNINNKGINVRKIYRHNGMKIPIDSAKIQQVFLNLFINAVKAIDENGALNIYTYEIKNGKIHGSLAVYPDLEENIQSGMDSGILVLIKDSGHGIKKKNLGRIFDPFYSSIYYNEGLGLYITHEIVREHKGAIYVNSTEGIGTTFRIILPNLSETNRSYAGIKNEI